MDGPGKQDSPPSTFRQFFFRGLAILLPSVLTIWLLLAAYHFVQHRIAEPINRGVRELVVTLTPWPQVDARQLAQHRAQVLSERESRQAMASARDPQRWLVRDTRRTVLNRWWASWAIPMDLIGLVIAIALIYAAGMLVGSYIGRRLHARGEALLNQVPLVGRVYPAMKQVTDFFVGQERQALAFNRVVAVQYPRKGLWSMGLVTGEPMDSIQSAAKGELMTVFIPSSPTPFTGYVITVQRADTVDLPINVEDAIKFAVSGGVLIPPHQQLEPPANAGPAPPVPQQVGREGN